MNNDLLADFASRGLIHDSTDLSALGQRLNSGPIGAYVGFDPTADSLHVGNLLGQISLRRLQLSGHRPIVLAGGATGMVGDPSGRSEERNLLDSETLSHNVQSIKLQLERILDFSKGSTQAVLVDNADWTRKISLLEFLRSVGKHITVNQMLAKDSVKGRLIDGNGLSFTEFSYMLLQANDFCQLFEHHKCEMQMGGSDQWGNITAGIDLIRKSLGGSAFGLTWPLVTKSDGSKFGKTADGTVWLDAKRTSPYQFRQYWMQLSDDEIERLMPQFSLRSIEEINGILSEQRERPESRVAQRALAGELTTMLHGANSAAAAEQAADILFGGNPVAASTEALTLIAAEVGTSKIQRGPLIKIFELLVTSHLASSNREALHFLAEGSVLVNGVKISQETELDEIPTLYDRWLLFRKGKTKYHLVEFVE